MSDPTLGDIPPNQLGSQDSRSAWLPDSYIQIFRSYVFGPSGFWIMATLDYAAKFDPFLSLDCAHTPSTLAQSKERKGSNFAIWQPWSRPSVGRRHHHPTDCSWAFSSAFFFFFSSPSSILRRIIASRDLRVQMPPPHPSIVAMCVSEGPLITLLSTESWDGLKLSDEELTQYLREILDYFYFGRRRKVYGSWAGYTSLLRHVGIAEG